MMKHPSTVTLRNYLDDDVSARERAYLAAHVAECSTCRKIIHTWRSAAAEIREGPVPDLPPDLLGRIQARAAAGERVILPVADPGVPRPERRWALAAAAVVMLLLIGSAVLFNTPDLKADTSSLRFAPGQPRAGQVIEVTYQPSSMLAGEDVLKLRARLRTATNQEYDQFIQQVVVAELKRDADGLFRGAFRLPDSVVYGAFAVEDRLGERVDNNRRRLWELLVHEADGRPSWDALNQRRSEVAGQNWELALEIARDMVRLYPDHPGSGMALLAYESQIPGTQGRDSLHARHRALFRPLHERLSAQPQVSAPEAGYMLFYGMRLREDVQKYWRERLIREHPRNPTAVHMRTWEIIWAHEHDTTAILTGFDRLWQEVGPVDRDPANRALQIAQEQRDVDGVVKWAERYEQTVSEIEAAKTWAYLLSSSDDQRLRETALPRLRGALQTLRANRDEHRPLHSTVEEQRLENHAQAGDLLAAIGIALIREGQQHAGLDTLRLAAASGWNVEVFRQIAEVQAEMGDTTEALRMWARVVVDPGTSAAFADSVRSRGGSRFQEEEWQSMLATAREMMRNRVLASATTRPLRGEIRLADLSGTAWSFGEMAQGNPTVVAFWSRHCGPSVSQLKRLQSVAGALQDKGMNVITITAERPSAELRRFLDKNGYTFPVFHDVRGDAKRVFNQWGTPEYFVLDPNGRVRFESRSLDGIERQIAALAPPTNTAGDRE